MIEVLFLIVATLLFGLASLISVKSVPGRLKVFAVFVLNCIYLCAVFGLYERVAGWAGRV